MKHRLLFSFVVVLLVWGKATAVAEVVVSIVFTDHMVLQQKAPIRVWGTADPGEMVTVSVAGRSGTAEAGKDGRWRVDLPALSADGKAHTMTVKGTNTIQIKDVVFGEVWLCSGQSNMTWSLSQSADGPKEVAAADHPQIRLFTFSGSFARGEPTDEAPGMWRVCTPKSASDFSAVGYYFGRELHKELKVPIGLIGVGAGGSKIEPWIPPVGYEDVFREKGKVFRQEGENETPEELEKDGKPRRQPGPPPWRYDRLVHLLTPFSVRGAIWYQGESNTSQGLYYQYLQEALVDGWRKVFENDDLSFYWVQLANFRWPEDKPEGGGWGPVREAQRRALRVPNTGMAVAIDIGDAHNIHPSNKQDVGKRLSLWALAKNYGRDIAYSGPLYKGMKKEGSTIRISFDHVGDGLMAGKKEGMTPTKEVAGAELQRFSIQDKDGEWHWAKAKIDGDTVVVWNDAVKNPQHVRLGYESNPVGFNLYNKDGLPASPFTTD